MSRLKANGLRWVAAMSLAFASIVAHAICSPVERAYLYVGDTSTDTQCNFDSIQAAIDAVQCPNTMIVVTGEHTYTGQHLTVHNGSLTIAGSSGFCGNSPPVCDPTIGCGGGGPRRR